MGRTFEIQEAPRFFVEKKEKARKNSEENDDQTRRGEEILRVGRIGRTQRC